MEAEKLEPDSLRTKELIGGETSVICSTSFRYSKVAEYHATFMSTRKWSPKED